MVALDGHVPFTHNCRSVYLDAGLDLYTAPIHETCSAAVLCWSYMSFELGRDCIVNTCEAETGSG